MKDVLAKKGAGLLVALALTCLGVTAVGAEPKSYPLLCKGGGTISLNITPRISGGDRGTQVGFSFQRSTRAATAGLKPGQCAWMDRGVNNKEPDGLVVEFPGLDIYVAEMFVDSKTTGNVYRYVGNRSLQTRARNLINAIRLGREFQVHAYNNGTSLIATRIGP